MKVAYLWIHPFTASKHFHHRSSALSDDDSDVMTSCVQVVFSPAHQHLVLLTLDIEVDIVSQRVAGRSIYCGYARHTNNITPTIKRRTVQLLNVYTGQVVSEYKLFTAPVRGIEVISELHLLAFSYPDPSSYGNRKVRAPATTTSSKRTVVDDRGVSREQLFVQRV
ncbi:hypothetical protein DPMN_168812 [Dreissena polymorpha]|uniref:Uncharacterized protein n=1 Tax=Dreissena polymorpha TaxID=45954 RepID=A0A9D4IZZ8_DREPO|nr:hypothetical protein DPMN_168812 [Dreissena polymorpha]